MNVPLTWGWKLARLLRQRTGIGVVHISGLLLLAHGSLLSAQDVVRVGHFPNLTHAQALVGRARGDYDRALAPRARVEWKTFVAGPSEIEALFAGALDLAFVGPGPATTGYLRSHGQALRVICGAASGGAALVVAEKSGIHSAADLHGKRVASPQLANTQDIALRHWLAQHGLQPREHGGDVQIVPIANADQLVLFQRAQLDAAWAPEPWASRLIHEAHARLLLDERTLWPSGRFVSAEVIARPAFIAEHRDLVEKFITAHIAITNWINAHRAEARTLVNEELRRETGKSLAPEVLDEAFARLEITSDPLPQTQQVYAQWAFELGFLGHEKPELAGLDDLSILRHVEQMKVAANGDSSARSAHASPAR